MTHSLNPSLLEELIGAIAIGVNILLSPLTRPWYSRWGSTTKEQQRPLPGDDLVPQPRVTSTRAITIAAPPAAVWPWLAQLGQGRGGLYSYQKLENLARCQMVNADRLHPEWQNPVVGDKVRFGPEPFPYQTIRAIDHGWTLVLGSPPEEHATISSWVFHLEPLGPAQTRLIVRYRGAYPPGAMNTLLWRVVTDPIFFVMERRMLIGIRNRVEALSKGLATA